MEHKPCESCLRFRCCFVKTKQHCPNFQSMIAVSSTSLQTPQQKGVNEDEVLPDYLTAD